MNSLALAYVAVGGAFGSILRYGATILLARLGGTFPFGTFAVNITGSFLMGIWIAVAAYWLKGRQMDLHLLVAVGALGGFTTFSTFSLDVVTLIGKGLHGQAVAYMMGSVILSILALYAGMALMKAFA